MDVKRYSSYIKLVIFLLTKNNNCITEVRNHIRPTILRIRVLPAPSVSVNTVLCATF